MVGRALRSGCSRRSGSPTEGRCRVGDDPELARRRWPPAPPGRRAGGPTGGGSTAGAASGPGRPPESGRSGAEDDRGRSGRHGLGVVTSSYSSPGREDSAPATRRLEPERSAGQGAASPVARRARTAPLRPRPGRPGAIDGCSGHAFDDRLVRAAVRRRPAAAPGQSLASFASSVISVPASAATRGKSSFACSASAANASASTPGTSPTVWSAMPVIANPVVELLEPNLGRRLQIGRRMAGLRQQVGQRHREAARRARRRSTPPDWSSARRPRPGRGA